MGIQAVHDKYGPVTARIADIHQIPYPLRPANRSTVFPDADVPHTAQGPTNTNMLPMRLPQQLVWLSVHTYHWDSRAIWLFVDVQDILHTGYGFCVSFWGDAPVGVFVRPESIFLMSGGWLPSQLSPMRAFSSKRRGVQRECPPGAGLQAIRMVCAPARPSTFRSAALEFGLIL